MKKNKLFITAALAAILFACSFTSCVSADTAFALVDAVFESAESIGKATEEITPENEYYIGRSVAASITTKYAIDTEDMATTKYLNNICSVITMNSSVPYLYKGYCVAIIDTDEINAMATPGGHIFVSRGLLNTTTSEDEIAAVIAHEIAHIQLKHSVNSIKSSRVTDAISKTAKAGLMIGMVSANEKMKKENGWGFSDKEFDEIMDATNTFSETTSAAVATLVNSGFSQEQEFAADAKALELLSSAGYDPTALVDMLSHLPNSKSKKGWGATHPKPKDRIKNVNKNLKKMKLNKSNRSVRQSRFDKII